MGWEALEQWGDDVARIERFQTGVVNEVWSVRVDDRGILASDDFRDGWIEPGPDPERWLRRVPGFLAMRGVPNCRDFQPKTTGGWSQTV